MARINQCAICIDWRTARDVPGRSRIPTRSPSPSTKRSAPDRTGRAHRARAPERRVRRAVLHRPPGHGRRFWDRLHRHFSDDELVDLALCVGRGWRSAGSTRSSTSTGPAGSGPRRPPDRTDGRGRMEKVIFLLWGDGDTESGDALRDRLLERDRRRACWPRGSGGLSINVHDGDAAPAPSPAPPPEGEDPHVAEVSVWLDSYEGPGRRRGRHRRARPPIRGLPGRRVPLRGLRHHPHGSPRDWPDGRRSPGVLTVALIHRPEGLGYREWISRWHGTQSPVSAELQPRTRYVRNEVVRSLSDGRPRDRRHRRGGLAVHRARGRPHAVLQRHHQGGARRQRGPDDRQRRRLPRPGRLRSSTMSEYLIKPAGLSPAPPRPGRGSPPPAASITYARASARRGPRPARHRRKHPWDCPSASSVSPTWGSPPCSTP